MRLNFSGVGEDEIREGVRRIGEVVREQVALYGTLTGRPSRPAPRRDPGRADCRCRAEPAPCRAGAAPDGARSAARRKHRCRCDASGAWMSRRRRAQGRALARAPGIAEVGRPRRGRARAARPRGRSRSTSARDLVDRLTDARRTSRSSRCTAATARTAPFRSCSRCIGIPYTGSGVSACIRAADKVLAKHAMRDAGIPTPDFFAFNETAFRELGAGAGAPGDRGAPAVPDRRQARRSGLGARDQVRPHAGRGPGGARRGVLL